MANAQMKEVIMMNKTWIFADAADHCYGICNYCEEEDCSLNPNRSDDDD